MSVVADLAVAGEPLIEMAALARRLAPTVCAVGPTPAEHCAWYHGFWPTLRVLGLAKACGGHAPFLHDTLATLAMQGGFSRVLVCGAADHGLTAIVLNAWSCAGAHPSLTVLDRCGTPLELARAYAVRAGAAITAVRADALDLDDRRTFDLIIANSFLGYFDAPARARLFARWARSLRRGGRVVLTNRLRPATGPDPIGFTPQQAEQLVARVQERLESAMIRVEIDRHHVITAARTYAASFRSFPVASAGTVVDALAAAGLRAIELGTAPFRPGKVASGIAGPSTAEPADYVRVVAERT